MTKAETAKRRTTARSERTGAAPELAPGLHAATIELGSKGSYRVRIATGERLRAKLANGVAPTLMDECRRDRRTVLVTPSAEGAVIVGAVQTQPSLGPGAEREKVVIGAGELELAADRAIVLRVGKAVLVLDESGAIKVAGEGVTLRAAKAVKVLAANVELP